MSVTAFSHIQYFSRSWMTETDTRWILTALFWDVLFFLRWVLSEMRGRRWGGVQQWELQSFARRRNRWEKLARGGWIPVKKKVRAERDRQHVRHTLLPLSLRPPHSLASLSLQPFSLFASHSPISYFKISPSVSFQSSDREHPGVRTPPCVIGRVWAGVREVEFAATPRVNHRGLDK